MNVRLLNPIAIVSLAAGAWCAELTPPSPPASSEPFVYTDWQTFTVESTGGGLPNDHIFSLKADGDRLWIGTEEGLALYENGQWKHWTEKDGLPWKVVTGIAVSPTTGDVWLALFGGGLARFSGGRFDHYHQLNSGLVNDVGHDEI